MMQPRVVRMESPDAGVYLAQVSVVIAGRSRANAAKAQERWPQLKGCEVLEVDITDPQSLDTMLKGADLVVHTAGYVIVSVHS